MVEDTISGRSHRRASMARRKVRGSLVPAGVIVLGLLPLLISVVSNGPIGSSAAQATTALKGTVTAVLITDTGPGTFGSEVIPAAQAAVRAVNATGGIRGRRLIVNVCDGHGDVNQLAQCARQAAANSSVVATVGQDTFVGGTVIDPILLAAKVPNVAVDAYGPSDYTTSNVFTMQAGGLAAVGGVAIAAEQVKAKTVSVGVLQVPAGQSAVTFLTSLVKPKNIAVSSVPIPPTTTDMSSTAAALIDQHPDAIWIGVTKDLAVPLGQALRQQGYTKPLIFSSTVFNGADIKSAFGANAGKILIGGTYSQSGAGWKQFQAEMKKYEPSAYVGPVDVNAWMGVHQLATVANKISGPITRASLMTAYNSLKNYSTDGLTPTLNYTVPNPVPNFGRVFNSTALPLRYAGHGLVVDIKPTVFTNFFTGVRVQPSP